MAKNFKNINAITLISLVITIVIMLILAGVSISFVIGQNGLFTKSKVSAEMSKQKAAEEKVSLILGEYQMDQADNNKDLDTFLNEKVTDNEIEGFDNNNDGTYTITVDGYDVIVKIDGLIIVSSEKAGGVRPEIETSIYKIDGTLITDDTKYDQVVVNVKVTNKSEFSSIDLMVLKDSDGNEITKETNVIGDNLADASYKVSTNGTYTVTVRGNKDGNKKSKTIQVNVNQISDRAGLKVGDYVNYNIEDNVSDYSLSKTNSGYYNDQTISQNKNLKWKILKINSDDSIDLISTVPTNDTIYFAGALGYNNGVYLMNDICEKLYSHGDIKARSINLEDIESQMLLNESSNRYSSSSGAHYGGKKTYSYENSYYPNLYAREKGAGINSTDVVTTGLTESDKASIDISTPGYSKAKNNILTVQQNDYNIGFKALCNSDAANLFKADTNYFVASRCAYCDADYASFGLRHASNSIYGSYIFFSNKYSTDLGSSLRPMVTLNSNVKVTKCLGENSETNMHEIQY